MRDTYTITVPDSDTEIPRAYKQIDFVKDNVLIEVQFGKYAFMFYDMAKFQYFFNENKADVGVEIVPAHSLHKQMSSGVSTRRPAPECAARSSQAQKRKRW